MDQYTNYLMISGAVLLNILMCLSLFFIAFKSWMWVCHEIRNRSDSINQRLELLTRRLSDLEKHSRV